MPNNTDNTGKIDKPKRKKMNFETLKIKIPRPHMDQLLRMVTERNSGISVEQHIDASYIASEVLMKYTQPEQ